MTEANSDGMQLARDAIDNGRISGQQLLVIALCFLFNMIDGFDITAMAVVGSVVSTELSLSPDRLGWIFSFAGFGMMIGAMFLAPVSDIIGRRKMIIFTVVLVGISILLTARATSLFEFMVLRFVSGVGAGAMLASQATLAAEYSPEKYRALSVAVVTSGYPMGAMMTSVAAGIIMPEYGWRGMFWFGGSVTLILAFVAWAMIPESLKFLLERRPVNALEKINRILDKLRVDRVDELPTVHADHKTSAGFSQTLLKLVSGAHRALTFKLWATFLFVYSALYFLMSWTPVLVEASGFTVADGRDAFLLFNLGGVVGIYLMGLLSTRWKLTNILSGLMYAASAGMILFAFAPRDLTTLLVIIFVVGVLLQGGFTGLYSVAAKAYPTDIRSTGIGWAIGVGRWGAILGPLTAGYLIAGGLDMAANFIVFSVPMIAAATLAYLLHIR
jgi:AAHS family 4-hydroxybenzoate transporter-like MFS transporter